MILCRKCRQLWSQGTTWCGTCRATLGHRRCPEGHVSPLDAECCVVCGSPVLTPGVPSLNLRPLTVCFVLALGVLAAPPLILMAGGAIQEGLRQAWIAAMNTVIPFLCMAGALSLMIAAFFGPRAASAMASVWLAFARFLVTGIGWLGRQLFRRRVLPRRRDPD